MTMKMKMKIAALLWMAFASAARSFSVSPTATTSSSRFSVALAAEAAVVATAMTGQQMGGATLSALTKDVSTVMDSAAIDATLPHRYPFALVDKVVEYTPGQRAVGIKCVTKNEEFFNGHFPGRPIMPGVLQVEALAQLAGIVCLNMEGASPGSVFFFAGVDAVKWKQPVVPGDTLVMEVEIKKWNAKFGLAKASGKAYVNGKLVVEVGEMTFALAK